MCISLPAIQMRSIDFIAALTIDIQGRSSEGKRGCLDRGREGGRGEGGVIWSVSYFLGCRTCKEFIEVQCCELAKVPEITRRP